MNVRDRVLQALRERPSVLPVLEGIIKYVDENPTGNKDEWRAFGADQIPSGEVYLMEFLEKKEVIKLITNINNRPVYIIEDRDGIEDAVKLYKEVNAPVGNATEKELPSNLFDCIIGYKEAKELFSASLCSEKAVHILMVSPPASAKSLFLLEMSRIPGSVYILGHSTSKAGLIDYLLNVEPGILLIDEIDKMSREDYATLLSLMETGIVGEMKYNRTRTATVKTKVFAACNNKERLPKELLSRFFILNFPPYNKEQFEETVVGVLTGREGTNSELAKYIATKTWELLDTRDVREAIRISRLCKDTQSVDRIISALNKYKQKAISISSISEKRMRECEG